jgi:hypothetical protein
MASLTESSMIFLYQFSKKNPNEPKKPKKEWYDRIYLCLKYTDINSPNSYELIKGFKCYKYHSLTDAYKNSPKVIKKYDNIEVGYMLIPVCKWVPNLFDKYILYRKLKNFY